VLHSGGGTAETFGLRLTVRALGTRRWVIARSDWRLGAQLGSRMGHIGVLRAECGRHLPDIIAGIDPARSSAAAVAGQLGASNSSPRLTRHKVRALDIKFLRLGPDRGQRLCDILERAAEASASRTYQSGTWQLPRRSRAGHEVGCRAASSSTMRGSYALPASSVPSHK
jgi:hypothetical protein